MGEGGGGEEKGSFSPSAVSLFRFHFSPFPQKRLILRLTPEQWVTHVMRRSLAWGILDLFYPCHKTEVFLFLFISYIV